LLRRFASRNDSKCLFRAASFIVGNVGPYASEVINTPKSKVYPARKMTVQQAIKKYLDNELEQLTEPKAKKSIRHHDE